MKINSFQSATHRSTLSVEKAKKSNIAIKASHLPINALAGVFWITGDIINTATQNYSYQKDPNIDDTQRQNFMVYRVSKIFSDLFFYYLPASLIEKLTEKKYSPKLTKKYLPTNHPRYKALNKVISLCISWMLTLPINDIIKPYVITKLTSHGVNHPQDLPNWLRKLLNL